MRARLALASGLGLALAASCLPKDTRPTPARVTVTAAASTLTLSGVPASLTTDGFELTFERVLVDLGDARLGGSSCSEYSNPGYTRLFDFVRVPAPQVVGVAFALGQCSLDFGVRPPDPSTLVGLGASAADRELMRTPGSDGVTHDDGVAVWVVGHATRGDEREHFSWPFRSHVRYQRCGLTASSAEGDLEGGGGGSGAPSGSEAVAPRASFTLAVRAEVALGVQIEAEELFEAHSDPAGPSRHFEPYARADADGDGEITLDELLAAPLSTARETGLYVPAAGLSGDGSEFRCTNSRDEAYAVRSLGSYAYCVLLPRVVRFDENGTCDWSAGAGRRD